MALTFGTPSYWRLPQTIGKKVGLITITFDSSYPTNGEAIAVTDIDGLEGAIDAIFQVAGGAGYVFQWDSTNSKMEAYWVDTTVDGAPLAEVANTTDLSAVSATFMFFGN